MYYLIVLEVRSPQRVSRAMFLLEALGEDLSSSLPASRDSRVPGLVALPQSTLCSVITSPPTLIPASSFPEKGPWCLYWAHLANPGPSSNFRILNLITRAKTFCSTI